MQKTLVVLAGPTAAGKTACGISLAEHFATEIISADSRQIYLETRIGTAVPSPRELARVKHHFIQTTSICDPFNASRFEREALRLLEHLFCRHDVVFMVGGSGLYIDAVCHGIDDLPPPDENLREELHGRLSSEGLSSLTNMLKDLDPESYQRIDLRNPMRVLKAVEVSLQTGMPYSGFLTSPKKIRPFRILRMALEMEREILYARINKRVEHMMETGLLEEAASLEQYKDLIPMKTVGYKELFRYLEGKTTLDESVDLIKRNTRKFARKQITWFRKDHLYTWFHPQRTEEMLRWITEA